MKILNIAVFVAAFILVTGGLMFLNSVYANIFKFDFTPVSGKQTVLAGSTISKNDPALEVDKQLNKKAEPLQKDSANAVMHKDTLTAPIPTISAKPQVIPVENKVSTPTGLVEAPKADITINNKQNSKADIDTIYQQWVKQTAKLYESMDPKKAAKIIRTYSESTARDIIYKMKKKQAAEILSELDPATANKFTEYHGDNANKDLIKN